MELEIHPRQSVGGVFFGANPEAVSKVLGDKFTAFVRNPKVPYVEHAYDELGVYVSFDPKMTCNAVLVMRPSDALLNQRSLLAVPAQDAFAIIRLMDPNARLEDDSLTSVRLGISVYAPDIESEPEDPAKSVLVFREDYFNWDRAARQ